MTPASDTDKTSRQHETAPENRQGSPAAGEAAASPSHPVWTMVKTADICR